MEVWIKRAQPFIRTALPDHLEDFKNLTETPQWTFSYSYCTDSGDIFHGGSGNEEKFDTDLCEEAKAKLLAWLDGMISLPAESPPITPPAEPLVRVRNILNRIPAVTRVLKKRRSGREPLILQDEYDLQYLLDALLTVEFRGVQAEEWTPSYASSSSRIDFLLKQEKIGIEVKYVRSDHNDRKIADELIIDKERYHAAHPECDTLVCFVYDPSTLLRNPEALQNDLSSDSPLTEVYVRPL